MNRIFFSCSVLIALTTPVFSQQYSEEDIQKRHTRPYPVARLHRDWMYQDHGLKVDDCFVATAGNDVEQAMVRKVLGELKASDVAVEGWEEAFRVLVEGKKAGNDPAWKALYLQACEARRRHRLKVFEHHPREFVYAKHFVFGDAQAMFAMTDHL